MCMAAIVIFSECIPQHVLTTTAIWNVVTQQHSFSFITSRTWIFVAPLTLQCLNIQRERERERKTFNTAYCVMQSSSCVAANLSKIIQPQTQVCVSTLSTLSPAYSGKRSRKVTAEGASGQGLMHLSSSAHTRYQIQQWNESNFSVEVGAFPLLCGFTRLSTMAAYSRTRTHAHHRQTDRRKGRWGLWG